LHCARHASGRYPREPVTAAKFFLQHVLDHLFGDRGRPGCDGPVKTGALPLVGISAGKVEGHLGRTTEGLANPVTGEEETFPADGTELVEFSLFRVGSIREPDAALVL
jgi:hypothetical protein